MNQGTSVLVMRYLILALLLITAPAHAADDTKYEELLQRLAGAKNKADADALNGEIWECWLTAPDQTAQELLDAAMQRRAAYDFLGAIHHLDRLVEFYPDYAEAWNQRATMYYLTGEYEKSLADVAETLAREPRHFGALAGKSVILFNQGKIGLAQIAVKEALKYHPFLNEAAILSIESGEDI